MHPLIIHSFNNTSFKHTLFACFPRLSPYIILNTPYIPYPTALIPINILKIPSGLPTTQIPHFGAAHFDYLKNIPKKIILNIIILNRINLKRITLNRMLNRMILNRIFL